MFVHIGTQTVGINIHRQLIDEKKIGERLQIDIRFVAIRFIQKAIADKRVFGYNLAAKP